MEFESVVKDILGEDVAMDEDDVFHGIDGLGNVVEDIWDDNFDGQ